MPKSYDIEQGLIIGLAIILLILANIAVISVTNVSAAELSRDGKIIVPHKARIMWWPPVDTVNVNGYVVVAECPTGALTYYTDSLDVVLDLATMLDSTIQRVSFYVKAYNSAGYSAPSDTVSLPMANNRFLFGDLNGDGKCNVKDSAILWSRGIMGTIKGMANFDGRLDVDANGKIDVFDHIAFIHNIGRSL